MSYTEEIVRPLVATLTKTAALPAFQLAAHVPNLDFWMSEVQHAQAVVDGYSTRFEDMRAAHHEFGLKFQKEVLRHKQDERPPKPLQPAMSPAQTERLKRELSSAATRLLERCTEEGFIDSATFAALRDVLKMNTEP